MPSINPTLAGFFTGIMDSINARIVVLEKHNVYSAYINFDTFEGGNILAAVPIPLYRSKNINFSLPLFVEYIWNSSGYDDYKGTSKNLGQVFRGAAEKIANSILYNELR